MHAFDLMAQRSARRRSIGWNNVLSRRISTIGPCPLVRSASAGPTGARRKSGRRNLDNSKFATSRLRDMACDKHAAVIESSQKADGTSSRSLLLGEELGPRERIRHGRHARDGLRVVAPLDTTARITPSSASDLLLERGNLLLKLGDPHILRCDNSFLRRPKRGRGEKGQSCPSDGSHRLAPYWKKRTAESALRPIWHARQRVPTRTGPAAGLGHQGARSSRQGAGLRRDVRSHGSDDRSAGSSLEKSGSSTFEAVGRRIHKARTPRPQHGGFRSRGARFEAIVRAPQSMRTRGGAELCFAVFSVHDAASEKAFRPIR